MAHLVIQLYPSVSSILAHYMYLHFRPLLEDTAVGHLVVLGALPEADPQRGEHPERLVDDHVEVLHADEGAVVWEPVLGLGAAEGVVKLLLKPLLNV